MGVSEKLAFLDAAVWAGKVFNGAWVASAGGVREVVEPATGQVMAAIGIADAQDVGLATAAAAQAQKSWAQVAPREKAAVFQRAAALFQQHFDE
jgi:benzaldehyde dehydrogenase (NAD)